MPEKTRNSGLEIIGNIPWGTHFCQFYKTPGDLVEVLAPYFKAGLEDNEFCLWITSEPLKAREAKEALKEVAGDLDDYFQKGQIGILDYQEWYTKTGNFESERVMQKWIEKEEQAREDGYSGMRAAGNTFWLAKRDWGNFVAYEAAVNKIISSHKIVALCCYSLAKCGNREILEALLNHRFALFKQAGQWKAFKLGAIQNTPMAAHGQLAAELAHEINNSLQIILSFTQWLLKDIPQQDSKYRDLKRIESATLHCEQITEKLLQFSK